MSRPTTAEYQPASACCFQVDPMRDPRWADLVDKHPRAGVFHSVPWLQALHATYGYEPVVFTASPPGTELKNGIVFCRVDSWLTGHRLVSLPFSDHCEPLCDSTSELKLLLRDVQTFLAQEKRKYFEVRPIAPDLSRMADSVGCAPAADYFLHRLDLRPDLADLFRCFDSNSVQRRIQRADRAGLIMKCGRSEDLLAQFYALFITTRRRQHVPPSPYNWFQNLINSHQDALQIRVAYKDEIPIAAILTLQFKNTVYYKYGCSDVRFNKYGATPWLFWKAITAAKLNGAIEFDMGRTQEDNPGLVAFKNHWVPQPEHLTYWRYPYASPLDSARNWKFRAAKAAFSIMPNSLLTKIGQVMYRHIG